MDGMQVSDATLRSAQGLLATPSRARRLTPKRAAMALVLVAATALGATYGYHYWTTGQYLETTDDATIKADYTTIAPKISGIIIDVPVHDNQPVKAGQLLARIDDRDFIAARDQAQADVAAATAAIRNVDAQISLQGAEITQAEATVTATRASLGFLEADSNRYQDLARTGFGTVQRAQQTLSMRDQSTAQLQRDQAGLLATVRRVGVLTTQRGQAEAQLAHAQAVERQAELNVSYTAITAPVDGTIGERTLRVGQYVAAGTQLMAVVPLDAVYIVANYKETQLARVRAGQPVGIEIDGLGDRTIAGHVDSLSPAAGQEFALLPPDNATGNFTKVVQRIPVRIAIDDASLEGLLRSGMSVEPTINTKRSGDAK